MEDVITIINQRIQEHQQKLNEAKWGSSVIETSFIKAKIEELEYIKTQIIR